ncbi:MAG: toxin-antitoxin system YwqK family antitoxin [Bacteroidales bacterium]|nr:toxin-antitoxin system YwqK family antitoxin [Bacteroidales bacterium]
MRRAVIFICLLCFVSIASGQESNIVKDGYQIFKYPNGTISSEGLIKNGKPEGFWKSYYVTGIKKSEGKRTNFLLDSIWIFYDQAGDTSKKINYLYGKKNGYYYEYKKDPSRGTYIYSKELFAGDKKEGTAYIYFPDGKIQQTIAWNGGKKEGLSKEYDKDGNLITLLEYNNDFLVSRERINRIDSKGLKQGEWKEFYPNGRIKTEKTYVDDNLHGYYKEYDNRGILVLTMLYENGAIVKSRVEDEPDIETVNKYDQDGKLIFSGPYRNNVPVGIHREFGKDGKVINALIYNDNGVKISEGIVDEAGNHNGKWKDFYPDGKIQAEGQYTDNRRSGQWKFYNAAQKVEQTGGYNNGRPDGLWKWYYENGALLREEEYFQGQRDGMCTEYSPSGEVIAEGQYSDGEKNGEWKLKNGDFTEEGKYIIGLKDGIWKAYYTNGNPKSKGNYVQGNPDGEHTHYYEDGKIKEQQYYRMGLRQKTWKKFDEEGNPVLVITYKDDVEISINGVRIKLPESDTRLIK